MFPSSITLHLTLQETFEMPRIIISDTSCFIVLTNIGSLSLLQAIYGEVWTTEEVATEYGQPLPKWVIIKAVADKQLQQVLELQVGKGESSAIALAMETPGSTLILDDYKARKLADGLGLEITGTIGVIIKAKTNGFIPMVKPLLDQIKLTDFHLSEDLVLQALTQAGE